MIYADDAVYWRFYAIAEIPTIRKDANNNPVFLLTKYRFSDDDLNDNPALPKGGGYLLFDVELGMRTDQRQRLMDHLNERVKEIWRRRQQALGHLIEGESGEFSGPQVELAMPEWTGGKTKFYVVDDPNLVKGRIADEAPSLIGSNTAIFNATLTPAGATYMQKTLTDPGGEGGTDLANVQVQYEVKFWGRLPPASISARADFDKAFHAVSSVRHDYEGRGCDEDISKTYEHYWAYMKETDAVSVKIDTGTCELDDDAVKELRMFVMQQLTKWIEETMLEKLEPGDMSFTDIADIYKSSDDVYRLKSQSQVVKKDFRMNVELTTVTEKTLYPQATLAPFFKDRSAEEMRQFVRELDLNDPLFKDVQVNVRAFADWSMETIAFVKVDVAYEDDVRSFNFTTDAPEPKQFNWGLKNDNREYKYRYAVGYKGAGDRPAFESDWLPEKTTQLNIPVPATGRLAIEMVAGNIDWKDVVDQVQIQLRYGDSANDVPEESFTAIITQETPSAQWTRDIFAPRERPVKYIQTFFLKDEQQIVLPEAESTGNRIVINEPLVLTLNTSIVTAGDGLQPQGDHQQRAAHL